MEVTPTLRSNFWGEWGGRGMQAQPCAADSPWTWHWRCPCHGVASLPLPPVKTPAQSTPSCTAPQGPPCRLPRTPGSSQHVLHTLSPHLLHADSGAEAASQSQAGEQ